MRQIRKRIQTQHPIRNNGREENTKTGEDSGASPVCVIIFLPVIQMNSV